MFKNIKLTLERRIAVVKGGSRNFGLARAKNSLSAE